MNNTETTSLPGDTTLPSTSATLEKWTKYDQTDVKYEVEDFFRTPEKTAYQLSPDGTHYAYLGPVNGRKNIFIQALKGDASPVQITHESERDISGYMWANDQRLLFVKDSGGDENFKLLAVDKDGQNARDLTPFDQIRIQIIDDLKDDKDAVIIGLNKNNPQLFEPYRLNINSGELIQLAENSNPLEPLDQWMTDHQGKLRLASKVVDGTNTVLMYRVSEDQPFREVIKTDFRESISPLFFDFSDPNIVFVSSNLNRDKSVIIRFNLETGEEVGAPVFSHASVDVSGLSYSRKRKVLTHVTYTTDKFHYHFLDEERAKLQERLEKELGNYEVYLVSNNRKEDKYIVRTVSDRSLGTYYFYDKNTDVLEIISEVSPWIDEADMASVQPIVFTSRDDLKIHGYLTLPSHVNAKNIPVIVNPHGGPWHRDNWGFNPEIQLMASRGYAVLQINFRGSTGYGRKFWEASFKQWGQTMQNDITDGVNWLIKEGIADPKRVAIYGGSYGGYATLAGVTYTPDLYCCAVDYVGVSNLLTFLQTIPPYWKPYLEMMYAMVGDPEKDREMMEAYSPALHADKIKTPLFVIQGANDPRVNIDEADQIVRSLRANGIEVPYMVKYNEGHGFHNEENKFEVYRIMMGFFGKYLQG